MVTTRKLKTTCDLRRYMASLINRLEADEVTPEKAGKLGYLATILLKVIEGSDLEERILKLEQGGNRNGK